MTHPVAPPPIRSSATRSFLLRHAFWRSVGHGRRPAGGALDEPQRGSIRGSAVSVTGFDDACLVAKLVGEPVADEHFDVRRHSLGVRSPLRRQRHLLRLRESLWVLVIHLISPLRPQSRVSGYNGCQRYYRAGNPERIGGTTCGAFDRMIVDRCHSRLRQLRSHRLLRSDTQALTR